MGTMFKSAKQKKTEKVHKTFEHVSIDYDAMNDIGSLGMHRVFKQKLALEIKSKQYRRMLDLCCGTGDMAFLLASQDPDIEVFGVDFSEQMLNQARKRQSKKGIHNIEFLLQQAEHLMFRDEFFDCVVISFGLRDVGDCKEVLREAYRVIRPGGTIYCLEASQPDHPELKQLREVYQGKVIPAVSAFLNGKGMEFSYMAKNSKEFISRKHLAYLMQKSGFTKVGCASYLGGIIACHRGHKAELNMEELRTRSQTASYDPFTIEE